MDTVDINQTVVTIPWETVDPGPSGEYIEVVDHDPASGCFYAPVDLNDAQLIATDGLAPAEGNPKFHQQMVYAVAMRTIHTFEGALGRKALWSPRMNGVNDAEYVQKLRLYPHALRDRNAYYNPLKKALLFGYFPARPLDPASIQPGGWFSPVFHTTSWPMKRRMPSWTAWPVGWWNPPTSICWPSTKRLPTSSRCSSILRCRVSLNTK